MENNEENKIQEAQISDANIAPEEEIKPKKRKYDFMIELALFFILGILIGIAVKNEAIKRITMGFDDYKMRIEKQDYDINKIQEDLLKKQAEKQEQENNSNGEVPQGEQDIQPAE